MKDSALVEAVAADWRSAVLDKQRKAMLEFTSKLTLTPARMTASDTESLRKAGFSDTDILNIAEVTAYYAYVNRIADGLGVELEKDTHLA